MGDRPCALVQPPAAGCDRHVDANEAHTRRAPRGTDNQTRRPVHRQCCAGLGVRDPWHSDTSQVPVVKQLLDDGGGLAEVHSQQVHRVAAGAIRRRADTVQTPHVRVAVAPRVPRWVLCANKTRAHHAVIDTPRDAHSRPAPREALSSSGRAQLTCQQEKTNVCAEHGHSRLSARVATLSHA